MMVTPVMNEPKALRSWMGSILLMEILPVYENLSRIITKAG
jgi:hypothetical protein